MDYITFRNAQAKEYREKNKEIIKEKRTQNRDINNAKAREYYEKNKIVILARQKEYRKQKREAGLLEFKQVLREKMDVPLGKE